MNDQLEDCSVANVFSHIAYHDGTLFTVWGPCSDGRKDPCDCPQCSHAAKLEAEGKDWEREYQKWRSGDE